jgi:hypothetical protein
MRNALAFLIVMTFLAPAIAAVLRARRSRFPQDRSDVDQRLKDQTEPRGNARRHVPA